MKAKELIEILSKNPEAEVGYECLSIARAHFDASGKYIDLSGESRIDKEKIMDTGVFIVVTKFVKNEGTDTQEYGEEVNAVYSTFEKAERMGKFLVEKYGECNGIRYLSYNIENFLILGK